MSFPVISAIISGTLIALLLVYAGVAVWAIWGHRSRPSTRFLPVVTIGGMLIIPFISPVWSTTVVAVTLPLLAVNCAIAWQGRAWLERSLRVLSAVWLLYGSVGMILEWLQG